MPDWIRIVRQRIAPMDLRAEREAEIAEEIAQHLEARSLELIERGATVAEAEAAALSELTSDLIPALQQTERRSPSAREAEGGGTGRTPVSALGYDVRHALRSLRRNPTYSAVATLILALAIGGCTLLFSVVNGILLRPLPYADAERLVAFWGTAPEKGLDEVSFPEGLMAVIRDRTNTLEKFAAFNGNGLNLAGNGDPERIVGAAVTLDYFAVFGVKPLLGRTPVAGEDMPNAGRVIVLGHSLWERRFGSDSAIIGQPIEVNGEPAIVVGVMPRGFDVPSQSEAWIPLFLDPTAFNCWCYSMVGRRKPQFAARDVRADVAGIVDRFGMERRDLFPDARPGATKIVVMSLVERLVGSVSRPLLLLFGAAVCVLLVACANIANLMLARTTMRSRELAVRCCIGASPRRLASQLLTESLLLSLAGAVIGSLLAVWGSGLLRQLPVSAFPRMDQARVDGAALLFAIMVAILTGLLCGAAAALRARRLDLQESLRNSTRSSSSRGSRRLSNGFVVVQFALSLMLLVGTGLLVRSYRELSLVQPGFRARDVLVARVDFPYPRFDTGVAVGTFLQELLRRVERLPGVQAAGAASQVPLTRGDQQTNVVAEHREPRPGEPLRVATTRYVSTGYFDAIGTPLLAGRQFTAADDRQSPRVAVVDERFARHFWSDGNPIGKRYRYEGDTTSRRWITVIGIVPNVKHASLDETPSLQSYESASQRASWSNYLVLRSTLPPSVLVSEVRRELAALDRSLPLFDVHTMQSAIEQSLGTRRLTSGLLIAFAAIAMLLAAIGIYGVISIGVNGRMREFGVRMAMGARPGDVERMVLRQGFSLALTGMIAGLAGAIVSARFLRGMLYGVGEFDTTTFLVVTLVLTVVALVACLLPARRAARSDPIIALSAE